MAVRGVFFDLGGTLFSYRNVARVHVPLLLEATQRLGATATPTAIKQAYAQASRELTEAYVDKPYFLHRDFFDHTFIRFARLLGVDHDEETLVWYRTTHHSRMLDCLELKPDCIATLTALKELGLYLSICSNIDDDMLEPLLARAGLQPFFDHWTSSETAQSCKPERRFFEYCLEKSGLTATEALFVGDSPEHDILGASAVGMRTALIIDAGIVPPLQTGRVTITADHTIHALSELTQIV